VLKHKYNGSLPHLLVSVYPDYNWLPWKFTRYPRNYWNDIKNQRKFMDWAAKELNVNEMTDWSRVTFEVTLFEYLKF
jgi:hypothetical protein